MTEQLGWCSAAGQDRSTAVGSRSCKDPRRKISPSVPAGLPLAEALLPQVPKGHNYLSVPIQGQGNLARLVASMFPFLWF